MTKENIIVIIAWKFKFESNSNGFQNLFYKIDKYYFESLLLTPGAPTFRRRGHFPHTAVNHNFTTEI